MQETQNSYLFSHFWPLAWETLVRPFQLRDKRFEVGMEGTLSVARLSQRADDHRLAPKTKKHVRVLMAILFFPWLPCVITISLESQLWLGWYAVTGFVLGLVFSAVRCIVYAFGGNMIFGYLHALSYVTFSVVLGIRVFRESGSMPLALVIIPAGVVLGVILGLSSVLMGLSSDILVGILAAILPGLIDALYAPERIAAVLIFLSLYIISYFRLPVFLWESVFSTWLYLSSRRKDDYRKVVDRLPLNRHDLTYFQTPFLRQLLVGAGRQGTAWLVQILIELGLTSLGQKKAVRLALLELQAHSLSEAAKKKDFLPSGTLSLPFFFGEKRGQIEDFFQSFQEVAKSLRMATTTRNHLSRERALDRASRKLEGAGHFLREHRLLAQGLRSAVNAWRTVIDDERKRLRRDKRENPQVPNPFVAGPVLGLDVEKDIKLFKGRDYLIQLIEQDLVGGRRGPILLIGQRRMGKSSLLKMLPYYISNRIVSVNFQHLSGSGHLDNPHYWIAKEVAAACPEVQSLPASTVWGDTLRWLKDIETSLKESDRYLLITIDEVERLEDEIEKGRSSTDLLDLIRASGDAFVNIRFLLATAFPPYRLGKHWVDRLINAQLRQLSPLDPEHAESLIREPMEDFPDIYPEGGVQTIIEVTGGHPFLLQLVCDRLCRRLNAKGMLSATPEDVEEAIDHAYTETQLFDELWGRLGEPERRILEKVAFNHMIEKDEKEVAWPLEREGYLRSSGKGLGIVVPLFKEWILLNT